MVVLLLLHQQQPKALQTKVGHLSHQEMPPSMFNGDLFLFTNGSQLLFIFYTWYITGVRYDVRKARDLEPRSWLDESCIAVEYDVYATEYVAEAALRPSQVLGAVPGA